jgi:phosphoglycolate phosphatase-like HAD superfamily hydrolase
VAAAPVSVRAVAIDLDGALGDTRPLWDAFLADAARRFHVIAELDVGGLPDDRGEAAGALDRWAAAGVGDWRTALRRFAEDHAPLYLRPDAEASACLRALAAAGARLGAFTDAPSELAEVALGQLGAARRLEIVESGTGALERVLRKLGPEAIVASTRADLATISRGG